MRTCSAALTLMCTLFMSGMALGGTYFFDDFEDGSATDTSPVSWNVTYPPWNAGTREVVNGDYVLTPDVNQPSGRGNWETDSNVDGLSFLDFSLRTQARVLGTQNPVGLGFNARDTHPFSVDGQTGHGIYAYLDTIGGMYIGLSQNNRGTGEEVTFDTDLSPTDYDVMLRLDVVGEVVKFWAWPAEDLRPDLPQLTLTLPGRPPTIYNKPGQVGVWNGQLDADVSGVTVPVAFRHFEVVPEPSALATALLSTLGLLTAWRHRKR